MPERAADCAKIECEAALNASQSNGKHRAIEVGKPYFDKGTNQPAHSITDFPEVEALIRAAHAGFGHAEPQWDRINIIIRSYRKGGRLTPHVDRPDLFGKDVYTCVLTNTSQSRLTFHAPKHKKWGDSKVEYRVPEAPGLCVHLTGPARTDWKHEVPTLAAGNRLSVSWRFYHQQQDPTQPPTATAPETVAPNRAQLIIFSLCDGIGAVPLAANEIWPGKVLAHAWEILEHSVKVVKRNQPWVEHHGDLLEATGDFLRDILKRCPDVAILVAAGFPCQDNSHAKGSDRLGIQGEKSGLIHDIAAFLRRLQSAQRQLGRRSSINVMWENVCGTSVNDAKYIAKNTGTKDPIELNAGVVSYATRPRLWWLTWGLTLAHHESWGKGEKWPVLKNWGKPPRHPPWHHTDFQALKPKLTCRMVPGSPDDKSGFRTNGIEQADEAQLERWEGDNKRLATYHYRADNLLWNKDRTEWRMPTPDEGDTLLGYPRGYTRAPGIPDYQREQMVGNTMHVQCVKRLLLDLPLDDFSPYQSEP